MAPRPITKPRCHNCRRKKIKCDYGRPECSQCKRSGLQCTGYERDLIFVSHNSETSSPPPATTKSRTTSPSGAKKPAASPSASSSSSSSGHSPWPDPPTFTTIEFYLTPPQLPVCPPLPPAVSPCRLLFSLNLVDLPQVRPQFRPLDSAINAVLAATSSYMQADGCYPTQSQTLYRQALFELSQSKECSTLRHDSWYNTAFTSLMLQLVEVNTPLPLHGLFQNELLTRTLQVIDGANVPIADWFSHSAIIANMPPVSSIQQFGASDILTLTFCRTAMLARDLFGGCELSDPNAWYLQSWGEAVNNDLHRVLDVLALLPSHIQQSELVALNPYDDAIKLDFEEQHKRLSALVQGLYTSQLVCGDFAPWVMHPYESFSACTSSDTPCMSVGACQRLAFLLVAQMTLFTANEKVRCSMPLTPESLNQRIEGDIEWFVMLETMSSMQHAIAHCIAVDNSLVGMQIIVMPLRMLSQFASSCGLAETQDWCRHTVQGLVDGNCQIASWSIMTAESISML